MKATAANYSNPIASRIVAHCSEERISLRELSRRAGLSESTAQKVCERLEGDVGDVGLATLTALASAMGQSLTWLLYGETPPAPTALRDLDGTPVILDASDADAIKREANRECRPALSDGPNKTC